MNLKIKMPIVFLLLAFLSANCLIAQDAVKKKTSKKSKDEIKEYPPVKGFMTRGGIKSQVEILGRSEKLLFFKDVTQAGKTLKEPISSVENVDFYVDLLDSKVQEAAAQKKWEEASAMILKAFYDTIKYIDVPENNAAEALLDAGNYQFKAAREEELKTPGTLNKEAEEKFKMAYKIFRNVEKADWYPGAKVAQIKSILCMLHLGMTEKAIERFEEVGEPEVGDLGYGLYWMTYARILFTQKKVKESLNASMKSITFDNKSIDSFPDSLLISAKCYEDILDYHRARDVYYEVAKLFQKTEWGDEAFLRLKFIMDKGLTSKKEDVDIEKVFFDTQEDVDAKAKEFIAQYEAERNKKEEGEEEDENAESGGDDEKKPAEDEKAKDENEEKPAED